MSGLLGACTTNDAGAGSAGAIGDKVSAQEVNGTPTESLTPTDILTFFPLLTTTTDLSDNPADLTDLKIYMEKTACEGPCPVYSVTVLGDGAVLYNGKTCVNVVGEQSDQISQEEVQALVDAFYENDFFLLEDAYIEDVQDIPSTLIRFTSQDQTHQVFTQVYDPRKAPAAFTYTADAIDTIANTQQWVAVDGTPAPCP